MSISCRSRVGSTQTGETDSVRSLSSVSCTHTNLKLEGLEMYETGLLPWDIEMTVEETVSDDDDGSPYRVSDSESESESELWKTLTNFLCNLE